jgi:hypothetical protein
VNLTAEFDETCTFQNQYHSRNYATYTLVDIADKGTVSSIRDDTLTPTQWRIDLSDREGSYMYVGLSGA